MLLLSLINSTPHSVCVSFEVIQSMYWCTNCSAAADEKTDDCPMMLMQGRTVTGSQATQKLLLGTNTEGAEGENQDHLLVYEVGRCS